MLLAIGTHGGRYCFPDPEKASLYCQLYIKKTYPRVKRCIINKLVDSIQAQRIIFIGSMLLTHQGIIEFLPMMHLCENNNFVYGVTSNDNFVYQTHEREESPKSSQKVGALRFSESTSRLARPTFQHTPLQNINVVADITGFQSAT